jgi:hypothetical protein
MDIKKKMKNDEFDLEFNKKKIKFNMNMKKIKIKIIIKNIELM